MIIVNRYTDKTSANKSQAVAGSLLKQPSSNKSTFQFEDNRPEAVAQRKLQGVVNNSDQVTQLNAFQTMANGYDKNKQPIQLNFLPVK